VSGEAVPESERVARLVSLSDRAAVCITISRALRESLARTESCSYSECDADSCA